MRQGRSELSSWVRLHASTDALGGEQQPNSGRARGGGEKRANRPASHVHYNVAAPSAVAHTTFRTEFLFRGKFTRLVNSSDRHGCAGLLRVGMNDQAIMDNGRSWTIVLLAVFGVRPRGLSRNSV